jgi:hypothetical protein
MLGCIISFNKTSDFNKCGESKTTTSTVARKMTSDIAPTIINNAYFKPSYKTPYYSLMTNSQGNDIIDKIFYGDGDDCFVPESKTVEFVLNLMVGDNNKYTPSNVFVNYLRAPEIIKLEEDDLYGDDRTKEMEFPDYVCYEIINEFVKLLLENTADPRLSTNVPINQSIIGEISAE